MDEEKEKLRQLEFACESIMEVIPKESCTNCPFVEKDGVSCAFDHSTYEPFRAHCLLVLAHQILKEIKERQ